MPYLLYLLISLLFAISSLCHGNSPLTDELAGFSKEQAVWLDEEKKQMALYQRQRDTKSKGSVLLISAPAKLPNRSLRMKSLFNELPDRKWNTLLISLPEDPLTVYFPNKKVQQDLAWKNLLEERKNIIQLAINYARQRDSKPLVIIAEQQSVMHQLMFMHQNDLLSLSPEQGSIQGLIFINASNDLAQYPEFNITPFIENLNLPTLDLIIGSHRAGKEKAKLRKAAGRKLKSGLYRQQALHSTAPNRLDGKNVLNTWIGAWLNKNF